MTDKERLAFLAEYLEKLSHTTLMLQKANQNYLAYVEGLLNVARGFTTPGLGLKSINGDYYDDKMYEEVMAQFEEERADKRYEDEGRERR